MSHRRLKIENLENLQELNAEEFSSIQGGLTEHISIDISTTHEISSIDLNKSIDQSVDVYEPAIIYFDPCYTPPPPPPCEVYVFDDGEKKIEFKWCPMIL